MRHRGARRRWGGFASVVAGLVLVAGCSGGSEPDSAPTDGAGPPTATAPATATPTTGLVVGAAVNRPKPTGSVPDASVDAFLSARETLGPLRYRRSFDRQLPATFAESAAKDDPTHGLGSFVSWKPPGDDFVGAAAGKYDEAITRWAKSVPRTGVYATSFHEPENDMTGPQFVALQRHLYTVVKAANPTIKWGPVYMSYWWSPGTNHWIGDPEAWWVGADRADFAGVDTYSAKPKPLAQDREFMTWYDFMSTKGVPLVIAEYAQYVVKPGAVPDPKLEARRAEVIAADAAWIRSSGKFAMWLYWDGIGPQGDWRLTDEASRRAWAAVAAAPSPGG